MSNLTKNNVISINPGNTSIKSQKNLDSKTINPEKSEKYESGIAVLFGDENYTDIKSFFLKNGLVKAGKSKNLSTFINSLKVKSIFKKRENAGSAIKVMLAGVVAVGAMFLVNTGNYFSGAKILNRSVKRNNDLRLKNKLLQKTSDKGNEKTISKTQNVKDEHPLDRSGNRARVNPTHRGLSVGIDKEGNIQSGRIILPAIGEFSSGFGPRWGRFHKGIDIAAEVGTPINAAMAGKVSFTGWYGGYGLVVEITHQNELVTRYAHCSKINVKTGQDVSAGENIAEIGMTGHVTGPHVHFEILANGIQVNPKNYM